MENGKNKCVKIYTRSFSLELYTLAKGLFDSFGWSIVRLTDQTADGYFYTMLKDKECDIAVNIDEDAFVITPEAIVDLVKIVSEQGYANAGCPDGGSGCPRGGNPIVTNPFFNVLNLELIRTKFIDRNQIKRFDYKSVLPEMVRLYPKEHLNGSWNFDSTDYEPYYPFFFWLAYNFKTLYLRGERHKDGFSTIVYSPDGQILCMHSWLARFYTMPSFMVKRFQKGAGKQKCRIDSLISEAYGMRNIERPVFTKKTYVGFFIDKTIRWSIKIPQRIAGWPKKIKKKLKSH